MQNLIYITEDDENIRDLVKIALSSYGYTVEAFETAEECLLAINNNIPNLIIFDIMLPKMNGIDAVKKIRSEKKYNKIVIIMLTAKDSEVEKIVGLDSGADDYMTKPFSVMELMARVRSLLRRSTFELEVPNTEIKNLDFSLLHMNTATREVFIDNELINLTFKEYEVLKYLIENKERVVSRNELLNNVWDYEYAGETRTVDIHIRTLRQKLGQAEDYIKTIRGCGYRFVDKGVENS